MSGRQDFATEVVAALALCLVAGALAAGGAVVLGEHAALRVAIAALGLAYVLRALARRGARAGQVVAVAVWLSCTILAWPLAAGHAAFAGIQVGLIWLARACFSHRSLGSGLIDLGLCALALGAAIYASAWTGSVFIAAWCFCLVQALTVAIPAAVTRASDTGPSNRAADPGARFERARCAAEGALRRLANA